MENETKEIGVTFKEFLDKTTNLFTLFGIFNALFIYSATVEIKGAAEFLLPSFFTLSLFIWLELIQFTLSSADGTKKYELFFFLLCSVEIGLVWYFVVQFSSLFVMLAIYGFFFFVVFLLTNLLTRIFNRRLSMLGQKKRKNIMFLVILVSFILSGIVLKISAPLLRPFVQKLVQQKVQSKTENIERQKLG